MSADVANIWVTGLRFLVAHPSIIGGPGAGGPMGELGGFAAEGSPGSRMRSEWLAAEFAQVDADGNGIVTEDVAVAAICKLCPGIKEAKVSSGAQWTSVKADRGRAATRFRLRLTSIVGLRRNL